MATSIDKTECSRCGKSKNTYNCKPCSNEFCYTHLEEHRKMLNQQLDQIGYRADQCRQTVIERKQNPRQHSSFQQNDKRENENIQEIKRIPEESGNILPEHINKSNSDIENRLNDLTKQLREIRRDGEVNELDLDQLKTKLMSLEEELKKPLNVSIQQNSSSFISKISIIDSNDKIYALNRQNLNRRWKQNGITVAGGYGKGDKLYQLSCPNHICIDDDKTIYIADRRNDRIVSWKSNAKKGFLVAGGNGKRSRINQLNGPTDMIIDKIYHSLIICDNGNRRVVRWNIEKNICAQILISDIKCVGLAMDKHGDLYVSDFGKHQVIRWTIGKNERTIVAGGNGKGNSLSQLNHPIGIFVDEDDSLYVSDQHNHRVMKWMKGAKEGVIVAGGNGKGNSLRQLSYPCEIFIGSSSEVYVADDGNNRVMRWCEGARQGEIVVGRYWHARKPNQLKDAVGLSFDQNGNMYVTDSSNHRVQKFEIDSYYQ